MSIEFSCACGKRFKVRDELAGKRGKCTGCGKAVLIPRGPEPEPEPDEGPDIYSIQDPVVKEPTWTVRRNEGNADSDFVDEPGGGAVAVASVGERKSRSR